MRRIIKSIINSACLLGILLFSGVFAAGEAKTPLDRGIKIQEIQLATKFVDGGNQLLTVYRNGTLKSENSSKYGLETGWYEFHGDQLRERFMKAKAIFHKDAVSSDQSDKHSYKLEETTKVKTASETKSFNGDPLLLGGGLGYLKTNKTNPVQIDDIENIPKRPDLITD